jgi:hypothetical protein
VTGRPVIGRRVLARLVLRQTHDLPSRGVPDHVPGCREPGRPLAGRA